MRKGCPISENILVLQEKGGKFKLWFLLLFMQKGGKIAETIFGKGALFNSQNDDRVPIFHGSAGTCFKLYLIVHNVYTVWLWISEWYAVIQRHHCSAVHIWDATCIIVYAKYIKVPTFNVTVVQKMLCKYIGSENDIYDKIQWLQIVHCNRFFAAATSNFRPFSALKSIYIWLLISLL